MLQSSSPDSTSSSIQSSLLAGRVLRSSQGLNTLPTNDDVTLVQDCVGNLGSIPVSAPGMYYVSPSQPEKRRQLRVPSPCMATMSMFVGS
jgi:hypothetical protein